MNTNTVIDRDDISNLDFIFEENNFPSGKSLNSKSHQFYTNLTLRNVVSKSLFDLSAQHSTYGQIEKHLSDHLYMITIQIKPNNIGISYNTNQQSSIFNALDSFFHHFSDSFITRSVGRNAKLIPFTQLFLDGEGSRNSMAARPIISPHFHGLLLLHPKTKFAFEKFLTENTSPGSESHRQMIRISGFHPLETITLSRFDPIIGTLEDMASYCTKFAGNNRFIRSNREDVELSRNYPRRSANSYPFYKYFGLNVFSQDDLESFGKGRSLH